MNYLKSLIETILNEAVALTKGSQRALNDKNLVLNLADAIRDDARSHPAAFPPGFNRTSQKAPDQQLAEWFLENIDKIEREGYDGIIYSRDGVNSEWIARRYIAGSHNWEDLTGVMNMNLCDWYLLKNRNMLDPNHKDLPKFNSVRDVGYYMTTHYKDKLEKLRDASKNAARNKMAKSIKLIDNDDYRVYTTLNRAAGCALGLGTQWCTANSASGMHYRSYSNRAMLFQLFPYVKEKDKEGKLTNVKDEDGKKELDQNEKYQFDAGGPNFMDVTDRPASAKVVSEKFPFLFTDLASALKEKKPQMEKAFADLSQDPTLQADDFKIKTYEIDDEIEKLHEFVDRGYFTNQVRKKEKPADELPVEQLPQIQVEEEDPLDTYSDLGSMGAGAGPTGSEKFTTDTAPTMPESFNNKGTEIMENVDKDVAAMLGNLKKYDKLVESCAPVLMARPKPYVAEEKEEEEDEEDDKKDDKKKNPWEDLGKDDEDDEEEAQPGTETTTHKGGKVTKTEKGLIHKKVDESTDVADPEVLEWMSRFSKLGNMKGYGR